MLRFIVIISLVWLSVANHVADASVIIIIDNPPPPPDVPDVKTRVQAIDFETGRVAFSHIIDGTLQSAALSDRNEVTYSVAEPGSSIFAPQSSLFLQKIGEARSPALLTHDGPIWNLGVTDSRLVWQDNEGIKVRSLADGTIQTYGDESSSHVQISRNRLLWSDWNSLGASQYRVGYVNLDSGDYTSYLFWDRSIQALALPQHVAGSDSGPIYVVHSPLAVSGGRVYSDNEFGFYSGGRQVPLYDDSGVPFDVRSVKTNGEQIVFTSVTERQIDESSYILESFLHLRNGNDILELGGPLSGEHALGPDATAWTEAAGGIESLFVHDIASGQKLAVPIDATEFHLWDMNGRYLLVASEVPEPNSFALVALGTLLLIMHLREVLARRGFTRAA